MHTDIVADFTKDRVAWIGRDAKNTGAICAGLERLILKHTIRNLANANSYAELPSAEIRRDIRAAVAHHYKPCASAKPMSVFGLAATVSSSMWRTMRRFEDVSGEFESYANAVASSVGGSDANDIVTATSTVVASASGINPADLEVVAAAADLTNSSAYYWESVGAGGGFNDSLPDPMSLFVPRRRAWWVKALFVVGVDAWGCVAGELSAWHNGHLDKDFMKMECAIWGGSASTIAGMGYLAQ